VNGREREEKRERKAMEETGGKRRIRKLGSELSWSADRERQKESTYSQVHPAAPRIPTEGQAVRRAQQQPAAARSSQRRNTATQQHGSQAPPPALPPTRPTKEVPDQR
jgi:hypothetical protein